MLRSTAFCLAAIGIVAAAVVVVHRGDTPDVAATQSLPETEIARADRGESLAAPSTGVLSSFSAAEVRALLDRLVTLDAVGALQDDALVRLVEQHLPAALEHVVARVGVAERGKLLARLADFAAGIDPLHALAIADVVADELARVSFRRDVLRAWSIIDAESVLAYVAAQTTPVGADAIDWTPLAQSDPEAALALVQRVSPEMQHAQLPLYYWARKDPMAAIAYADANPDQRRREAGLGAVGQGYARAYPQAAWRWVNGLDPPSSNVRERLALMIASDDPDLFVRLVLDDTIDEANPDDSLILGRVLIDVPLLTPRFAERLAEAEGRRANALLGGVISHWSNVDSTAALDWLVANADRIELEPTTPVPAFFTRSFATEPARAGEMFERLPPQFRGPWLADVGSQLASRSPDEAMKLVGRLEGGADSERALTAVILGVAARDPLAAQNLFATAPAGVQENVAAPLASGQALEDAAAAAAWAEAIANERPRQAAVRSVVATWFRQDEPEARRWIDELPRGPLREAGLSDLLANDVRDGVLDEALLGAFATAASREAAVVAAVGAVATDDLVESLAAGLRGANGRRFFIEALERKAATEGYGAFRLALGLKDDTLRTDALMRIAPVWAEYDARGSIAAAEVAPIELQRAFRSAALLVWARNDAAGVLRYIETSDISAWTPVEIVALRHAFAAEPERAREVAQRFPTPFRNIIEGR